MADKAALADTAAMFDMFNLAVKADMLNLSALFNMADIAAMADTADMATILARAAALALPGYLNNDDRGGA